MDTLVHGFTVVSKTALDELRAEGIFVRHEATGLLPELTVIPPICFEPTPCGHAAHYTLPKGRPQHRQIPPPTAQ